MKRFLSLLKNPVIFFRRLTLKKKIIVVFGIIILLVILTRVLGGNNESGYVTESVKRADISQTVSETGNVEVGSSIAVTSPSTGHITEVFVDNGQTVNEGDILFTVESSATEQEQAAAYANYLTAVATQNAAAAQSDTLRAAMYGEWDSFYNLATNSNYETSDGDAREDERLAAEFQIAQDEWEAAEKRYKDNQTAIAQAQAQVASTWLLYQATQNAEVKANAAGTVANLSVVPGGDITANDENALIIVSDNTNQTVVVSVSEIDIPKINAGQPADVEIDAIDDEVFKGEVSRVDSVGTNTQGVITYNVYINLLDTHPSIFTGMTASVEIKTETARGVLSVPNTAVKPYQGGRAVQVLENGKPKYIPVKVGVRGDERTQILEGLEENQQVIIGARNELIQRESNFGF